jgi:hypothetical protein
MQPLPFEDNAIVGGHPQSSTFVAISVAVINENGHGVHPPIVIDEELYVPMGHGLHCKDSKTKAPLSSELSGKAGSLTA